MFPGNGLTIGTVYRTEYSGYTRFFDGSLDNVAVYDRALSDTEVLHHYCSVLLLSGNASSVCE